MSGLAPMIVEADDRQLLRSFVSDKSPEAFAELVRRNAGLVYSAARRQTSDAHLAEDVTQAVFLLLAQKSHTIHGAVPGWLLAVTFNASRNARKIAARRAFHESRAGIMKTRESNPSSDVSWESYAPELDGAIAGLPSSQRDLIALRFFRNQSLREVGQSLGISEDAARKRLDRAIQKLRASLAARSAVPSMTLFAAHLSSHATQAAPGKLVESIAISLGTGTKGSAPFVIASKTAHALTVAKLKLAAAILVTIGVLGTAAVATIKLVASAQETAASTPVQSASPAAPPAAVVPPTIPEASVPGTIQIARWHVFVNDRTAQQLRQILQPVKTDSAFYSAFRGNGAQIRNLIADSVSTRGLQQASNDLKIALDHSQLGNIDEGELQFSDVHLSVGMGQGPAIYMFNCYSPTGDDHYLIRSSNQLHFDINDPDLMVQFYVPDGPYIELMRTPPRRVAMQFQGDVNIGDALVMMARYVSTTGRSYYHVVVWEAFHALGNQKFTMGSETSSQWWCVNGPDKLRHWADASRAWAAQAGPPDNDLPPPLAIQRNLSDGKSIWLTMLARPSLWPGCWWNPAGGPVNTMGGITFSGDPPGGLWFELVLHGNAGEWPLQHAGVTADSPQYSFDYNFGSTHQEGDQTTALRVGAPVGVWREIGRLKLGEKSKFDGATFQVICPSPSLSWLSVDFSRKGILHDQYEIVAVDGKGQEYFDPRLGTNPDWAKYINVDAPEQLDEQYNYQSLNSANVAYFRLMRRKREFVTFDGFATEPLVAPQKNVTAAEADAAEAKLSQRQAAIQLNNLEAKRKIWEATAPDSHTPAGFMRLLIEDARHGDAADIRRRISTPDPQIGKLIDEAISLFILNQSIRTRAIELFGIDAVDSQFGAQPLLVDIEAGLMDGQWTALPDGKGYQMVYHDQYVLRPTASGELFMDVSVLPSDERTELLGFEPNIAPMIARGRQVDGLLKRAKPPTLEEFTIALQGSAAH